MSGIRAAAADDLLRLAHIHAACFAERWTAEALAELLQSPGVIALVAPCGFVMARVAADEAEILTLAVEPSARRKGTASALLAEAARRARKRGATAMFLEVSTANRAARALYRQLGFATVGRRRSYYGRGRDALILKRDLPLAQAGKGRLNWDSQPPGNDRDAD